MPVLPYWDTGRMPVLPYWDTGRMPVLPYWDTGRMPVLPFLVCLREQHLGPGLATVVDALPQDIRLVERDAADRRLGFFLDPRLGGSVGLEVAADESAL